MSDLIQLSGLQSVMPRTSAATLAQFVPVLQSQLADYEINTPLREAHFIAQLAHESGGFEHQKENLNYSDKALRAVFGKYFPDEEIAKEYARQPEKIANRVYANRIGNGDEASGEGWKYRGRGLIQLTGKANYAKCAESIGSDLVNEPDLICQKPAVSVSVACWFWQSKNLNKFADEDDVTSITKRINGGLHGIEARREYLSRCKQVLGLEE